MAELSSKFSREDIETLLEAMGDWEVMGNHEFHALTMIKNAPMPPQDHEAYDIMSEIKTHFRNREKDILATRATTQEKSIFLKAKLLLVRRDLDVAQLFDMAAEVAANPTPPKPASEVKTVVETTAEKKLELAEYFIQDLGKGVWDFYQKFLAESKQTSA